MTASDARQEAAYVLADWYCEWDGVETPCNDCVVKAGVVLDLISPAALARLAVERGGLVQVGWHSPGMADGPNMGGLIDGKFDNDDQPVYRIVEATDG